MVAFVVISLADCKKSGVALSSGLIGKWELHERYGGNIYPPDTLYKPGNGNMLQFNADSTYKSYANGMLIHSGIFHTRNHFSYSATAIRQDELYFDNDTSFRYVIQINANILLMKPIMPDIATTDYEKISN